MSNIQFTDGVTVLIKHKWKIVLAVLILLTAITFLSIIFPLLDGIVMGVVLAYVARPMKNFMDSYTPRLSPYIATAAIVLPIFLIIGFGIIEIFNLILWTFKNQDYVVSSLLNLTEKLDIPDFAREKIKDIISNFTSYLLPIIKQLPVVAMVQTFSMFIINALLAVLLCFFLLVDGGRLVDRMMDVIPQEIEDFFRRFVKHLDGILSAIFVGNTYSAVVVGLISLIVFWIFGFANILALSALMLLAALIPMLAGWMVIVPLTIYKYFETGGESAAIFFVVSFLVIIIPPELLIRPYIIHTRSDIHPLLIIVSFVGGGLVGGIAGFLIAPMMLGVIVAAYRASSELRKNEILKHE